MSIKDKATTTVSSTKRVVTNAEQFVQAAALLTVAGFSYWALTQIHVPRVLYWVVLSAVVIIGLRGAVEVIKFLDKKA